MAAPSVSESRKFGLFRNIKLPTTAIAGNSIDRSIAIDVSITCPALIHHTG